MMMFLSIKGSETTSMNIRGQNLSSDVHTVSFLLPSDLRLLGYVHTATLALLDRDSL